MCTQSPNMRWAGHIAHKGEMRNTTKFWSENLTGRDRLRDVDVYRRMIRGCIQTFPDWPPGARTANGTALCH
jgi:hypothetical protein